MQPAEVTNLSLLGLLLHADPVVKGVMALLVLASIAVWAIAIDRTVRIARIRRDARRLDALSRGPRLDPEGGELSASVLRAGQSAAGQPDDRESRAERQEQLRETMRLALNDALRPAETGLPFLATVGSTAPFVGLFGTVWGIMASFAGIAASNDTSLATVAPGIAEALFSTAIGLAAAIPAVVAYNRLITNLARSRSLALSAIARLADRLSRVRTNTVKGAE